MVVGARMTPDLGTKSERVKSLLDRALEQQLALIEQAVRTGQLDGSIRKWLPASDAARTVVALVSGMRVLAQAGSTPNELRQVVMLGLDALRA